MQSDDRLRTELARAEAECNRLREENARLKACLGESNLRSSIKPAAIQRSTASDSHRTKASESITNSSHSDLKISLFRNLFRGRNDVYAIRWEGKGGKTGYSPAGIRDWEQPSFTKTGKRKPFRVTKPFPLSDDVYG